MKSYKGRTVEIGQIVDVYRNLNLKDSIGFSIKCAKTGLVLGHATSVLLEDCEFIVKEKGRQRVLKERRKNVHAWVRGRYTSSDEVKPSGTLFSIYYNPYKTETFIKIETKEPVVKHEGKVHCEGPMVYGEKVAAKSVVEEESQLILAI